MAEIQEREFRFVRIVEGFSNRRKKLNNDADNKLFFYALDEQILSASSSEEREKLIGQREAIIKQNILARKQQIETEEKRHK